MSIQISDEQMAGLQLARSAIRNAISRNRIRMVDVELVAAGLALDEVLGVRSQSEQTHQNPVVINSTGF